MANWRICIPSNPLCEGAHNQFCVNNVSVALNEGVTIKVQVHYQNSAFATEFLTISGDEYKEWGQDDNWIYQKIARTLCLGVLADSVDASGNQYSTSPHQRQTIIVAYIMMPTLLGYSHFRNNSMHKLRN